MRVSAGKFHSLTLLSVVILASVAAAQRYTIMDVGSLGSDTGANALNHRGQVVGCSFISPGGVLHAFLSENGKITDLGTLGGSLSCAQGVNDAGLVVGNSMRAG